MNVNGLQVQLQRGPAQHWLTTLLEDLRVSMKEAGGSLAIRFVASSEITQLAQMLGLRSLAEGEGVFATLAAKIGTKLDFGFNETELTLNIWQAKR